MKSQLTLSFEDIISPENLLWAWDEFLRGKRFKRDVLDFQRDLMDNIFRLHKDLANRTYSHGGYTSFHIRDPKPRHIHKPIVRDRLLHHAIYRTLYPFFDRTFIADSYSCRVGKGTHAAMDRFAGFGRKVSNNHTRTCWVLKCDIQKFFASIDHDILLGILSSYIPDRNVMMLLGNIIRSFELYPGRGLPLGNLTSQLFVNVYMNVFDQYVKHDLRQRYYIRYADDFVFLSPSRSTLQGLIWNIESFLRGRMRLQLHPKKVELRTYASGVDFLGWVHFPHHRVLRGSTKRRVERAIDKGMSRPQRASYLGLLSHGNCYRLSQNV